MEALRLGDFDYFSRLVDENALKAATDEEAFAEEAFEQLRELGQSVALVAGVQRLNDEGTPRALTRDEAFSPG